MGVKVITKLDRIPEMKKAVQELKGKKIHVGIPDGELSWLAGIHEYGCTIMVTPKMRAFLHYKGVHLKKDTTEIVIPERSFLRSGHDQHIDETMAKVESLLPDVIGGTMSVNQFCDLIGLLHSSKIKEYATNLSSPAKSSLTIKWGGGSNPLIRTGQMVGSITWEVEG